MAEAEVIAESAETPEDFSDLAVDLAPPPENAAKDLVAGRFKLLLHSPLPALSKPLAQAFEVQDLERGEAVVYALVFSNDTPYRMTGIDALKNALHPALTKCLAAAPIPLSTPDETRMVAIVERPTGKTLEEIIKAQGPLPERFFVENILKPLAEAMKELEKFGINHGCLNPSQIYFDKSLKITEMISLPSGYGQDFHYESPERLLATPSGKGSGNASADSYAFGMLAVYLTLGDLPLKNLSQKEWEERILKQGSCNALTGGFDPSELMTDLLRGTLNDSPKERWSFHQIADCLNGKRFNLVPPSTPHDCNRPFTFLDRDYLSYRALAHALFNNWQLARTHLSPAKLVRWMELNPSNADAAEAMYRAVRISDVDSDGPALKDEELMKIIAVLDPHGPMRFKEVSVNIDGLGKTLAQTFRDNNTALRQQIVSLIDNDLPNFLSSLLEKQHNTIANHVLWVIQKLRPALQLKGLGFGIERILYGLNPSLPCQSPLVKRYHLVTLQDLLHHLDRMAPAHMNKSSLVDNHLAAFLTSKLELTKELRILELAAHPDLVLDSRLLILKILAHAQQKMSNVPLKGLAAWVTAMMLPVVQKIHRKSSREHLIKELKKAAKTGLLGTLAFLLFQDKLFTEDRREFERAKHLYKFHRESIAHLNDDKKLKRTATLMGRKTSANLGYLVLGIALYFALDPFVSL